MTKKILTTSGFLGLMAVLLFILERIVFYSPVISYFNFNSAVFLHFFGTLSLLMFAFKNKHIREAKLKMVYYAFLAGVVFACTPLYLIHFMDPENSLRDILKIVSFIGSGAILGGWVAIIFIGISYKSKSRA